MKRILIIAISLLMFWGRQTAWAGTCEVGLMPAFNAEQAKRICVGLKGTVALTNLTVSGTLGVTGATTLTGGITGNLKLNTANTKIIPGATTMVFRNAADSATNWTWTDAGALTQNTSSAITFSGDLTGAAGIFTGLQSPVANYEAVAGAGTTVADAAALAVAKHVHQLTGANGTLGWKFTTGLATGQIEFLLNTTAGVAKVYGESGSTCNGGATDAACSLLSGIAPHICYKTAALTYICS